MIFAHRCAAITQMGEHAREEKLEQCQRWFYHDLELSLDAQKSNVA